MIRTNKCIRHSRTMNVKETNMAFSFKPNKKSQKHRSVNVLHNELGIIWYSLLFQVEIERQSPCEEATETATAKVNNSFLFLFFRASIISISSQSARIRCYVPLPILFSRLRQSARCCSSPSSKRTSVSQSNQKTRPTWVPSQFTVLLLSRSLESSLRTFEPRV